jgi:hypothetical protein
MEGKERKHSELLPLEEIEYIIRLHYSGIEEDIQRWYTGRNALLGGSPNELINAGRAEELLEYIKRIKS